jgi:4-hydroxy-2-oxoheptanedioate aldolase
MRISKVLQKIRAGKIVRICALGHFIPSYIRHAAHYGFDAIWMDCEHRAISTREIQALMPYFHQFDIDCMLRAPTLEKTRLYRFLEDGATGLMIPHVSTPQKAQMLVQSVKFPPLGDRGLDGAGYDSDFMLQSGESYTEDSNRETFLVVQIETLEAVNNIEAIAAIKGVDGLFIGPGDLGLRIKHSETSLSLDDVRARVAKACVQHGKAWGLPAANEEIMAQYAREGAQLLAHGGDFRALKDMLEASSQRFDRVCDTS